MKTKIFSIFLLILITSCSQNKDFNLVFTRIEKELDKGNLTKAKVSADSLKKKHPHNKHVFMMADSLSQIAERIGIDFSLTREDIINRIEKQSGDITAAQIDEWESKGWIEGRKINGTMRYFNRAASNLFLLKDFYDKNGTSEAQLKPDSAMLLRLEHTGKILSQSTASNTPVNPVKMSVTYTITVDKNAVPDGQIIRCWMPWPKSGYPRQQNVKLISTSEPDYTISPESSVHSSIYMEGKAVSDQPTVFSVSFSYESSGQYFDPSKIIDRTYDKSSWIYRKYTHEQLPQIHFSPEIKHLADSLCAGAETPVEIVKRIYYWFKNNIPWAGALEYSIIPDIPGYVLANRKGDCGQQTLLFISMLRYKGIPCRWQSGWMVPPKGKNLHDWSEVYYEGTGWVPVDISYDLQDTADEALREFYFSGIDAYRLIVNQGIAGRLYPAKKYLRSEPFDFQRGEVEWKGGNLYFNKWDYTMEIKYLP